MPRKPNVTTGEFVSSLPPGLSAPFPIPAYKILGKINEHNAQRVLTCLVSHLGDKGMMVHPSYSQIQKLCGMSRSAIKPALDVLEEFGFIRIFQVQEARTKKRNKYYIHESGYDSSQMNRLAAKFLEKRNRCIGCAERINRGEYKIGPDGPIHLGCGGHVMVKKYPNKAESIIKLQL